MQNYDTLKTTYIAAADEARTTRARMRQLKCDSRKARAAGDTAGADRLMWSAIEKWAYTNNRRDGRRCLHLAYCFARGRTYRECEQKVREGNEPDAEYLQRLVLGFDGVADGAIAAWLTQEGNRRVRPETVVETAQEAA